jgi:AraC-like DNA-binding protein
MDTRPSEITNNFLIELDRHIADIVSGKVDVFFDIKDFADILCIHPVHLSNTIKQTTGKAPCDHCEERLIVIAKEMVANTDLSFQQIAVQLTFDGPGFTRFFKKNAGLTPSAYREQVRKKN